MFAAFFKSATRPRDDLMRVLRFLEGFSGSSRAFYVFLIVFSPNPLSLLRECYILFFRFGARRSLVESFGCASRGLDGGAEG